MSRARDRSQYQCSECGATSAKWSGQCADCGAWNTLQEFVQTARTAKLAASAAGRIEMAADVVVESTRRSITGIAELDRVLGGGLVPGSVVLLGGDPGIGKSTLLVQCLASLSDSLKTLYVTGEESLQQVTLRATRRTRSSSAV